jgi:hypothetical protein
LLALRFRLEKYATAFFSFESSELQPKFRFSEFALRAETGASQKFEAPLRGWPRHRATNKIVSRSMEESAAPHAADSEVATTQLRNLGQKNKTNSSSHCSSVEDRLATYGSEALDSTEHLGLILGSPKQADALLKHFASLTVSSRASVDELYPSFHVPKHFA